MRPLRSQISAQIAFLPILRTDISRPPSPNGSSGASSVSAERSAYRSCKSLACAVTSKRVALNGSTPRSRSAAKFARRAARSSASRLPRSSPAGRLPSWSLTRFSRCLLLSRGLFLTDGFDLVSGDAARRLDVDGLALLLSDERAPERRFVRQPMIGRIRFGRTDDREIEDRTRLQILDLDVRAEMDLVRDVIGLVDDARVANHRLNL